MTRLLAEVARVVQVPPETFRCFPFRVLAFAIAVDFFIGELGANSAIAGACRQSRVFGALSLVVTRLLAEVARVVQAPPETFRCFPFLLFTKGKGKCKGKGKGKGKPGKGKN